jgi:hypothetical protein
MSSSILLLASPSPVTLNIPLVSVSTRRSWPSIQQMTYLHLMHEYMPSDKVPSGVPTLDISSCCHFPSPPPPSLGSTLPLSRTVMVFGSDSGPGPAGNPGGAASASENHQQQTAMPFLGGCKPTPRSIHTISMQHSKVATTTAVVVAGSQGQVGR